MRLQHNAVFFIALSLFALSFFILGTYVPTKTNTCGKICTFEAGDFVEHKLHGWPGIVLWTSPPHNVTVRIDFGEAGSKVWENTIAAEWKHLND